MSANHCWSWLSPVLASTERHSILGCYRLNCPRRSQNKGWWDYTARYHRVCNRFSWGMLFFIKFDEVFNNFSQGHLNVKVIGRTGQSLSDYFDSQGGPTGYIGTMMPGFPNFFTILGLSSWDALCIARDLWRWFSGANTTVVHGSALFSEERQVRN